MAKSSINTYLSFKRVRQIPNNLKPFIWGHTRNAKAFNLYADPGSRGMYLESASRDCEEIRVRIDISTLVESVFSAEAQDAERWEPLVEGPPGLWGNDIVSCSRREMDTGLIVISYHRRDRAPLRDWRIGQKIKNELAGPEAEGVELYPAESRVVDTSNESWLFCWPEGKLPFGFADEERLTQDQIDHGPEEGRRAIQRDDPDVDTSSFDPASNVRNAQMLIPRFSETSENNDPIEEE